MKFGITQAFTCSYLAEQQEQLLVLMEEQNEITAKHYDLLIGAGFRRSGTQVYRPNCPRCQACQPIRLPVQLFSQSKSQKRVLKLNQDITIKLSEQDKPEYYPIYETYINQRHADGSMYPASYEQYAGFIINPWDKALFIELWLEDKLIGVAVCDKVANGLSALYTFFLPQYTQRSLGTYAILQQIKLTQQLNLEFLYLGYQIDTCQKMSYKQNFLPHERFLNDKWQLITKKAG
ncbi:arginyltransferase [Paraglaciecola hydrolytica]|uniref:Aspartate/glutamate leucyltransferase n=1 Tax=Paraglaciecola hydrolytica TaxID=1799789 RepID=A0A136A3W4_9ALTE|nr:arginyltransferase [Paraglaciecola hydrolytica]KXI29907.1 arginyl-tRNA-protein transferase [Paraglaciecola hydrolytica]